MKKLIKFNILFMILIVINTTEIICQTCGSTVYCPPGIKYPFYICDFNSPVPKIPVICAEDPYNIPGFQGYGKDYAIRRISLPICFDIDLTTIPEEVAMPLNNVVFSKNKAVEEINRAAFSWNCICGKENEPCSCSIKVKFSDLEEDFQFDGKLAYAKTKATFPACNIKCGESFIIFNNTTSFRKDAAGNVNRFFINDDFITTSTISKVYSDGYSKVYNFFDVMLHEAGHILGFDHYDDSIEPPYIGCYPPIEGVMSSVS